LLIAAVLPAASAFAQGLSYQERVQQQREKDRQESALVTSSQRPNDRYSPSINHPIIQNYLRSLQNQEQAAEEERLRVQAEKEAEIRWQRNEAARQEYNRRVAEANRQYEAREAARAAAEKAEWNARRRDMEAKVQRGRNGSAADAIEAAGRMGLYGLDGGHAEKDEAIRGRVELLQHAARAGRPDALLVAAIAGGGGVLSVEPLRQAARLRPDSKEGQYGRILAALAAEGRFKPEAKLANVAAVRFAYQANALESLIEHVLVQAAYDVQPGGLESFEDAQQATRWYQEAHEGSGGRNDKVMLSVLAAAERGVYPMQAAEQSRQWKLLVKSQSRVVSIIAAAKLRLGEAAALDAPAAKPKEALAPFVLPKPYPQVNDDDYVRLTALINIGLSAARDSASGPVLRQQGATLADTAFERLVYTPRPNKIGWEDTTKPEFWTGRPMYDHGAEFRARMNWMQALESGDLDASTLHAGEADYSKARQVQSLAYGMCDTNSGSLIAAGADVGHLRWFLQRLEADDLELKTTIGYFDLESSGGIFSNPTFKQVWKTKEHQLNREEVKATFRKLIARAGQ
jgi:hypothetical protein